ncbi:MAG: PAS domain S-box protein [Deltaproteobacteria bacterium]|nr:PAS domain S-box protein [Deltaproteobacteria bacterium]
MSEEAFPGELEELRARLREAEETLEAIRTGAVDAIVVSGKAGDQVYTLQGADQSYRLLVESINEGTVTISADGTILYSNRQFADMLGHPLENIIGASLPDLVSKDDRHLVVDALHNCTDAASRFQVLLNSREWGKIPAQITMARAGASGAGMLTAVITNLSEQFRYREIVREEKLSRSIMENSPSGIAVCDTKGVVIRASRTMNQFCGPSVLMKPFDQICGIEIPATDRDAESFHVAEVLAGKTVQGTEARLRCSGGKEYEIVLNAVPLRDEDGAVIGCLVTMRDITWRKRAEAKLRSNEARFRAFFENADVGTAELSPDGHFIEVNERLCRMTGYSAAELRQMTPADLSPPEEAEANRKTWHAYLYGSLPVIDMERRVLRKDGGNVWMEITASMIRSTDAGHVYAGDKPALVAMIAYDITERKKAETFLQERTKQLEDANRELESFSYSVSHDLKTPLRTVEGFSRMFLKKYGGGLGEDAVRMLGVIHDGTERMGVLIDNLLSYARVLRSGMAAAAIDMTQCAGEVRDEIRAAYPEREMEIRIARLLPGYGDRTLIRQALHNLLSNAVKFTKHRKPAVIEIGSSAEDGSVVYCIKDNGAGFDMAYYHKLFGVFQRLHSVGEYEGTGVGLAIVQRIVQRHGGRVWAEGEVDKGACFYFSLPAPKG